MKLGLVTYLLGRDWDVATLIKNCTATGFEGVELRSTQPSCAGDEHGYDDKQSDDFDCGQAAESTPAQEGWALHRGPLSPLFAFPVLRRWTVTW